MASLKTLTWVWIAVVAALGGMALARQGGNLVQEFLDALNTKDSAKLGAFVSAHFDSKVPADARAKRMMGLAEQGAPFRLVKMIKESREEVRAEVEDKGGMRLGFILKLDLEGHIQRIEVGDPGSLDAPPPKDYRGWKDLKGLAQAIQEDTGSPAISIAVYRNREIAQALTGPREVGKPQGVQPSDPWSIGSIGKPLCSTLMGLLIERGKLRWNTTLAEALPDLSMQDGYKAVTLEQVMHHRGGIPEDPGMMAPQVQRIVNGATDPMAIRENYARDILSRDPIAKPGERFAYSNAGYVLLGVIAERTMHKPYESLVRDMIFKPLGMKHSFTGLDVLPESRPSGHMKQQGSAWKPVNFKGPLEVMFAPAGGGMWCSMDDMVRFGLLHMNGLNGEDGLLHSRTIKRLHQGIAENGGPPDAPQRQYACGWGIETFPGIQTMHTHNGSNGTMRAQLAIFPKAHLVVASVVNCGGESEPSPPLEAVLAVAQKYAKADAAK